MRVHAVYVGEDHLLERSADLFAAVALAHLSTCPYSNSFWNQSWMLRISSLMLIYLVPVVATTIPMTHSFFFPSASFFMLIIFWKHLRALLQIRMLLPESIHCHQFSERIHLICILLIFPHRSSQSVNGTDESFFWLLLVGRAYAMRAPSDGQNGLINHRMSVRHPWCLPDAISSPIGYQQDFTCSARGWGESLSVIPISFFTWELIFNVNVTFMSQWDITLNPISFGELILFFRCDLYSSPRPYGESLTLRQCRFFYVGETYFFTGTLYKHHNLLSTPIISVTLDHRRDLPSHSFSFTKFRCHQALLESAGHPIELVVFIPSLPDILLSVWLHLVAKTSLRM